MKKILAVLLLVIVSIPFLLSFEVENRYRGLLSELENSGYQLTSHEYDRGFFHSVAKSNLSLPVQSPQGTNTSIDVTIVSDIVHGPYSPSLGWFGGIAQFETVFYQQDKPLFPAELQASINTSIEFSGDGLTKINLPALEEPMKFDNKLLIGFSGLEGEVHFNSIKGNIDILLTSKGMDITSKGEGKLAIGAISLQSYAERGIEGILLGKGNFNIDSFMMNDFKRGLNLNINNIKVQTNTYAVNKNINMLANYEVEALIIDEVKYGPANLEIELTSVSAEAMARIQENVKELQRNKIKPEEMGVAFMGSVMSVLPAVFEQNPTVSINKLEIVTPEGTSKLEFSLKANNMTVVDLSTGPKFLNKLIADASIQVPEVLVKKILSQSVRQRITAALASEDKEIDALALEELVAQQVEIQLGGFLTQGFIEKNEANIETYITSRASLKEGLLNVNGKVLPLPVAQ